ncbi:MULTISPECIES: CHAP domain-containing protein [Streptomyces]|uniref:CHAP domain-containing protein n=1 Tax=Streptomyces TaxID=1883 RepID=UPI001E4013AE|nr:MULTISPECIES: CHAP domain-containing protein [Streptomyces]UFQ16415.1 CHAP domain-containing protein [Streptomyces huasconensis]WCL86018.1 CHAP domain-containing protein [Streptomyces sp. JCM 35825]
MAVGQRGAIKVGTGYISIEPHLNQEAVARLRTQMGTLGRQMATSLSASVSKGFKGVASATAKAAKDAKKATEKEAVDTSNKLRQIERSLTRFAGEEAGRQFRTFRNLAKQRTQLEQSTSKETRKAISDTLKANRQAISESLREERAKAAEKARLEREARAETRRRIAAEKVEERALAREVTQIKREQAAEARLAAQQQKQAERELREAVRQRAAEERAAATAQRDAIRAQIRDLTSQRDAYAATIAANQRQLRTFMSEHRTSTRSASDQWKVMSQHTETFGQNLEQVGRAINMNLVAPLAAASGYMMKIGTQSADMQFLASAGLGRAGFDNKQVAAGIKSIQDFAVHTPFSLEDMTDKFQQLARNFESYGDGPAKALDKSEKMIRSIADYAASFGVLDPERVKGAMYAADMMMDLSKINTRSIKQFSRGTGIPINKLGQIAGYEGSKDFLKDVQDPKKGVQAKDFFNKFIAAYEKETNVQGTAEKLGTGSIGGALASVKEQAQLNLGRMFGDFNPDTGEFEWTELGKQTHALVKRLGDMLNSDEFEQLSGGLLRQFVRALMLLTSGAEYVGDFLGEHPAIKEIIADTVKIAALMGPLALAIGLATKVFGKIGKSFLPLVKVSGGLAKGARGLARTGNQTLAGVTAGRGNFRQAYQQRRADYHGGDDRSLGRRVLDRVRGRDSRADEVEVRTEQAQRNVRQLDDRIKELKDRLQSVNRVSIDPAINALGGTAGGRSMASAARDAAQHIQQAANRVQELNGKTTGGVRQQVEFLSQKAETAQHRVKDVSSAVTALNGRGLKALRQEFDWTKPKVTSVRSAVQAVIDRMTTLNGKPLKALRDRFKGGGSSLHSAVDAVAGKLSTANSRMDTLGKKRVTSTTTSVNNLKSALKGASDEADSLKKNVGEVNTLTGFGGGGDGKGKNRKPSKHAMGGVLPGYAPGVDSIPAILSPGEAILRPEVTARLGEGTINAWNAAAARGHLSRFAKGGVAKGKGRWPFSILGELTDSINFAPAFNAFSGGIDMAAAGSKIGGSTGRNVRAWGARAGGDSSGRAANNRFANMRSFMFERLPDFLKATPTGIGNVIGLAAGAIAPTAGDLFWRDIWKGEGNILQRGAKFTSDLLSPSNLLEMIKDLFGGVADMAKGLGSLAKDLISDPAGVLDEAISTFTDLFDGVIDSVNSMIGTLGKILGNPSEYAREVWDAFYEQAKENLPNTEGLFKFANGGIVPGYAPGNDRVHALLAPGEAVLRPDAVRALGYRTVLGLNADAKAGKLADAKPDQAVTPVPDAAAFEAAAKRIEAALASMTEAVKAHQTASAGSWTDIGSKVAQAVDGQVKPAQNRWISHLGQLTSTERTFRSSNQSVWADVSREVSSSTSNTLGSFGRLRTGVDQTKRFFEQASSRIREVWRSAMTYVDSSTRTTVSGPYNKGAVGMIGSMAKLAGTNSPLSPVKFNTGGVVPGYLPGVDKVPAVLSPGEGILRPEVVRALGKETILHWNEQARRGGNLFANGGVVGDGGSWVRKHKDDPYDGYEEAVHKGWDAVVEPGLKAIASEFGTAGKLNAGAFGKAEPWLAKWGKWADDHTGGGGGQVVKLALQEAKAGDMSGRKYIGSSAYESWCADFVSWIVDHAGANAAYGGSPKGTPQHRWPAVATWVSKMSRVPTGQARPGDLMVYKGYGPGAWGHINIATGKQGKSLETVGGNESRSIRRQLGYGDRADGALRPRGGAPGTGKGPVLNPWPGSLAALSEGVGDYDMPAGNSVNRWRPLVERVIRELNGKGGISLSDVGLVLRRIGVESGGDPHAVNNWDSNAAAGMPSKGLLQVIKPTFDRYAGPYRSLGQFDPLASVYAGLSYAIDRYGSGWRRALSGTKGYWTGTKSATAGLAMVGEHGPELVNFRGGERVYNARRTEEMVAGRRYEIHIHEAKSEDTTAAVLRAMRTAEVMAGF